MFNKFPMITMKWDCTHQILTSLFYTFLTTCVILSAQLSILLYDSNKEFTVEFESGKNSRVSLSPNSGTKQSSDVMSSMISCGNTHWAVLFSARSVPEQFHG